LRDGKPNIEKKVEAMKKLLVLMVLVLTLSGCAVVTPYGTDFYVPLPGIAVAPDPYYGGPGYYDYHGYYGYGYPHQSYYGYGGCRRW
jgi:hypothetical protein